MKRSIISLLAIVVMVGLVVGGCRPKPPEQLEFPEEMSFGMVVDLSGPHAEMGKRLSVGAEVAVEHMNEWGGIRNMYSMNLKLIVADDGGLPERAAAEAERLIAEEGVIFLMGAWPTAMAVSEVAETHEVPFICPLSLDPITERGYAYTFRTVSDAEATAGQVVSAMTKSAEETGIPPPKTCFLIRVSDDQGVAVAEAFKLQAEEAGMKIVGEEVVDSTVSSFASQLAAIEAVEPDVLFSCNYTNDSVVLYREMMERETYFPYGVYSWGWGTEDPVFYESLPLEAYEYGFVRETGDPLPQGRHYYEWINDDVQEELGQDWDDPYITTVYNTIWIAKEGLERMVPPGRTSAPGKGAQVEFSLDLDEFRGNLQYALATMTVTRGDTAKIQLPDGSPFLPALQPMLLNRIEFDGTGQNLYGGGLVSQTIDGIRWPLYPEEQRETGSPSVVLPIPPWSER